MAKKNTIIAAGLNGLLGPAPTSTPTPEARQEQPEQAAKQRGNYTTVCYSIPPEIAEKIRYIAYWDRKKLNAVVVEAFEQYAANWNPSTGEKPKTF